MYTCTYANKCMFGYSLAFRREQDWVCYWVRRKDNTGKGHLGCGRGYDDYCFSSFNFVTDFSFLG